MDGIEGNFGEIFSSPFFFLRIFFIYVTLGLFIIKKSAWYQDLIYTWVRYPFSNPRTQELLFPFFQNSMRNKTQRMESFPFATCEK